jgi:Tol biopolymer transport system component
MTQPIQELLELAAGQAPPTPPPAAISRRSRRQARNLRLVQSGAAATVVAVAAAVLFLPGTDAGRVRTVAPTGGPDPEGTAPAPRLTEPRAPVTTVKPARASLPAVRTKLPPVTLPGQAAPLPAATPPPTSARVFFLSASQLVSTRVDGSDQRVVVAGNPGFPLGAWPDASRLLLEKDGANTTPARLLVLNVADGTTTTVVSAGTQTFAGASLSPDGSRIAYSMTNSSPAGVTNSAARFDIHVANADGSGDKVIVNGQYPVWAPDSSMILVQKCGPDGSSPCTVRPDGSGQQARPNMPFTDGYVAWSPDGQWLAGKDANLNLALVHLDGSGLHKVGHRMGTWRPAWTPDGSRIVYKRDPDDPNSSNCGTACDHMSGISSAAADGSGDWLVSTESTAVSPVVG